MATGTFNSDTTFTASEAIAKSAPTGSETIPLTIPLDSAKTLFINSGTKVLKVTLMGVTKYIGVSEGKYYNAQWISQRAGQNLLFALRNQDTGVIWGSGGMPWSAYGSNAYSISATVSWSSEINTHTPDVEDY